MIQRKNQFFCTMRSILLIMAAFPLLFACDFFNRTDNTAVITIGNRKITGDELKSEIQQIMFEMGISEQEVKANMEPIVNKVIEKSLILIYGEEAGIKVTDDELNSSVEDIKGDYPADVFKEVLLKRYIDFDEWKEDLRQELLIEKIIKNASAEIPPVTYNEAKGYFESHRSEFKRLPRVQLRQVVTGTKEEAEKILERIKQGSPLDLEARKHSITPEAKEGGMLGWIAKGELPESIEKTIFSLSIGEISPIIQSHYGFHIFEVLDTREGGEKDLPEVMKEIETTLILQKKERFYEKWINQLTERYPVSIKKEIYKDWHIEG